MEVFRSLTADKAWCMAQEALMATARTARRQPSRSGETLELLHSILEIEDPRQRFVVSRFPAINPAFGIAEVLWILVGSNDANVLNYWFPHLPAFAGEGAIYGGAYGYRLRRHFGVDQLRRACDVLSSNPSSRQVVLQLWDVTADLPAADGTPRSADIPCNVISMVKVREGRLEWTQIMRSNDLYRGLPYNLIQFTLLQEVLAGWLHVGLGGYHHWSDSLHIYVTEMARFSRIEGLTVAANEDSLAVDVVVGEALIADLYERMIQLTKPQLSDQDITGLDSIPDAPLGYQNLLHILSAESARRRGRHDHAMVLSARCTNPQLSQVWSAWLERTRGTATGASAVQSLPST